MQHGAGLVERPLAATSLGDCMLQLFAASGSCKWRSQVQHAKWQSQWQPQRHFCASPGSQTLRYKTIKYFLSFSRNEIPKTK